MNRDRFMELAGQMFDLAQTNPDVQGDRDPVGIVVLLGEAQFAKVVETEANHRHASKALVNAAADELLAAERHGQVSDPEVLEGEVIL